MALVNLAQIKGGLQLRSDVNTLIASYDANKVLTTVVKTPAIEAREAQGTEGQEGYVPAVEAQDAVNYDADELLGVLKAAIDDINGGGSGTSLASLQEAVDNINNKEVADIVKLTYSVDYTDSGSDPVVNDYLVTIPAEGASSIATLVPSIESADVLVYSEDNEPVLDADGDQITLNLNTGRLSAVPHRLSMDTSSANAAHYVATSDTTAQAGKIYFADAQGTELDDQPAAGSDISAAGYYELVSAGSRSYEVIAEDFNIKVFPVGTFKFEDLPANFLLDNEEMKLIAYTSAINTLVEELAADQSLIEAISAKVGAETVANQVQAAITKSSAETGGVSVETITDSQYISSDSKVISEKLTLEIIDSITRGASADALDDARNNADRIDALQTVLVPTIEQIAVDDSHSAGSANSADNVFKLTGVPNARRVKMNINGQTYYETTTSDAGEFTVDRTATPATVTWTMVPVAAQAATYAATEDTTAQAGKTYYADANGTPLDSQPEAETNISSAGYFEQTAAAVEGRDGFNITESLADFVRIEYFVGEFVTRTVSAPEPSEP